MIEGEIVKALRESLNESQTVFGERFGVGQTTIFKWETMGVRSSLAERAVQALMDELSWSSTALPAKAGRGKARDRMVDT